MKIGDVIRIIEMKGEPHYTGKTGTVTFIDDAGQLHGTWGGLAVIPEEDEIEIAKTCCLCGNKFFGYGHNAEPLQNGVCCDECNVDVIMKRVSLE